MQATKLLLMIACGMGVTNTNAASDQELNLIKSPEILIITLKQSHFLKMVKDLLNARLYPILVCE